MCNFARLSLLSTIHMSASIIVGPQEPLWGTYLKEGHMGKGQEHFPLETHVWVLCPALDLIWRLALGN